MEFGVRVWFRFGTKIVSEPHLNCTRPQRGSWFGLRARTGLSSGLGFGENCLRTGLHWTVASLRSRAKSQKLTRSTQTGQSMKQLTQSQCYDRTSLTYADTSDCIVYFLSSDIPHRSPCTIRSLRCFPVRYDLSSLSCTISISEPPLLRYLVLGEYRSLST